MYPVIPAVRIRTSQIELLGSVLTRAFYDDPRVTYLLPDARTRRSVLSWFFSSVAIRASRLCGEIYTTVNVEGGALWISPGIELTIGHAVKTEMLSVPFKLDRSSVTRWINVNGYLESVPEAYGRQTALVPACSRDRAVNHRERGPQSTDGPGAGHSGLGSSIMLRRNIS
jgi:hypothetical protein